jgi:hypothetical protein
MLQTTGKAPLALSRRIGTPNEQHLTIEKDDRADADKRLGWKASVRCLH